MPSVTPASVPFPWFGLFTADASSVSMFKCDVTGLTLPIFTSREYARDFQQRTSLAAIIVDLPTISTVISVLEHPSGSRQFDHPFVVVFDPVEPKFDEDHRYFPHVDILAALRAALA